VSNIVSIPEITVHELAALGSGQRLSAVREPEEWAEVHIATAVHVPLATVPEALDRFDGSPTYVICKVGGRSYRACELADANGLDVVNVAGGMMAWLEAGFEAVSELESGPGG
jgi:rhodanese-related sulfurtransferase